MLLGLLLAIGAAVISKSDQGTAIPMLLVSSFVYIMGGMLAVSHFDFRRGSPAYLGIMLSRMAYALAAVITLVRAAGG